MRMLWLLLDENGKKEEALEQQQKIFQCNVRLFHSWELNDDFTKERRYYKLE